MNAIRLSALLTLAMATAVACGGSDDSSSSGSGGSSGSSGAGAASGAGGSVDGGGGSSGGGAGGSGGASGSAGSSGASGTSGSGGTGGALTAQQCNADVYDGIIAVNYDQFDPTIGSHCAGTNHQDITGVERVVFLGDSITKGTPPTPQAQFYRVQLEAQLRQKFGQNIEVADCSVWGARNDDFLSGDNQIPNCFQDSNDAVTLTVITMGGNDIADMAQSKLSLSEANAQTDQMLADFRTAIEWLIDPVHFPNGNFVVFANLYEFTDFTGNLSSCPTAGIAGFDGEWLTGTGIWTRINEQYMKIAVDTGTDMIFMGESFCGHGFNASNDTLQCFRGPGTETWFDITCIHPTPAGHSRIAEMFYATIDE